MTQVLVLRPEPGNSATVQRARMLGLQAVGVPLFRIEPLAWDAPVADDFDALLLTSANAIRHGGANLVQYRDLPVHAVGDATATAARDGGFDVASVGTGGVDTLLATLPATLRLLHLRGQEHHEPLGASQQITAVAVYRAVALPLHDLPPGRSVALVHSARAGRRLAELITDRSEIAVAAISQTVADACGLGWRGVETAPRPADSALLSLAARMCQESSPE